MTTKKSLCFALSLLSLVVACSTSTDDGTNGDDNQGTTGDGDGDSGVTPGDPCAMGEAFEDECTTCSCVDQKWSCTEPPCSVDDAPGDGDGDGGDGDATPEPGTACDGTSATDPDACGNYCQCTDGQWACTDNPCPVDPGEPCQEGAERTQGCSECFCANGGWLCTGVCDPNECSGAAPNDGSCSCVEGQWICEQGGCDENGDCAENQYCYHGANGSDLCGFGETQGTCEAKPDACTEEYAPVCGCDGNTYPNACAAAVAGQNVMYKAACQQ